jgi:WD repeat-containing protein 22
MILKGHRSIVNQVRFNHSNYIIASSGVEKLIKVKAVWEMVQLAFFTCLFLDPYCLIYVFHSVLELFPILTVSFMYFIQFWSPFPLPESTGSLMSDNEPADTQRKVFTHEEYITLVLRSGQVMFHISCF